MLQEFLSPIRFYNDLYNLGGSGSRQGATCGVRAGDHDSDGGYPSSSIQQPSRRQYASETSHLDLLIPTV